MSKSALRLAPRGDEQRFAGYLERLERSIDGTLLQELEQQLVSRRIWLFSRRESQWQHDVCRS